MKIKNILKIIFLFCGTICLCAGIFATQKNAQVNAEVNSISALSYNLTVPSGYDGDTIFLDAEQKNTLSYATLRSYDYYNENGDVVSDFETILGFTNELFKSTTSYGKATFNLPNDMRELASAGLLSVRLKLGVLALNSNKASTPTCSLKVNTKSGELSEVIDQANTHDDGVYAPLWSTTEYIKLDESSTSVAFDFISQSGTFWNPAKFVIFEPKLEFKVEIDSLNFDDKTVNCHYGDILNLTATNKVSELKSNTTLTNYLKELFKVRYEIVENSSLCYKSNNNLLITYNGSEIKNIKVLACCYLSTDNTKALVSTEKTISIINEPVSVQLTKDFANCTMKFYGSGTYYCDEILTINQIPLDGYEFHGWYVGDELLSLDSTYEADIKDIPLDGDKIIIKAKYTKDITLQSVSIKNKVYDGTNEAVVDNVSYSGVIAGHDVSLNLQMFYNDCNAEPNKTAILRELPTLSGSDAHLYTVKVQGEISAQSDVLPKDVQITTYDFEKTYGDSDPELRFDMSETLPQDNVAPYLVREEGEDVGIYNIYLRNIEYSNYNIHCESVRKFTINEKQLCLNVDAEAKFYDKTNNANLIFNSKEIPFFDENKLSFKATFNDEKAGTNKIVTISEFVYDDPNINLSLQSNVLHADILPKEIIVTADAKTIVFGQDIPDLTYSSEGLLAGDALIGNLVVQNLSNNAGVYTILLGTLYNENYSINYTSAKLTIEQKDIVVIPSQNLTQIYGEKAVPLTYSLEGAIEGETLRGILTRQQGTDVGDYRIELGSLSNENYRITLLESYYHITKRDLFVNISPKNKTYDGTLAVDYNFSFSNLLSGDQLSLSGKLQLLDADANSNKPLTSTLAVLGEKIDNYNVIFTNNNYFCSVLPKPCEISLFQQSFVYGETIDIEFQTSPLVEGETLNGGFVVESIEAGKYRPFTLDIPRNNPNYSFIYKIIEDITILPRLVEVRVDDAVKFYMDSDPAFNATCINGTTLPFSQTLQDWLIGYKKSDYTAAAGEVEIIPIFRPTQSINFQVHRGKLTTKKVEVSLTIQNAEKIYKQQDAGFIYHTDFDSICTLSVLLEREQGEDVGTYIIKPSILEYDNFIIADYNEATLKILPKKVDVFARVQSKIFGKEDNTLEYDVSGNGLAEGDGDLAFTGSLIREQGEDVGEYQIMRGSLNLNNNYEIIFHEQIFTILPATLTVRIEDCTKIYGEQDPSYIFEVKCDSIMPQSFGVMLGREAGENVGEYQINATIVSGQGNYTLKANDAYLHIKPREFSLSVPAINLIYGEKINEITYSIDDQTVAPTEITVYCEVDISKVQDVGTYKILYSTQNSNYLIHYVQQYATISKRIVNIVIDDAQKIYGEQDPILTYTTDNAYASLIQGGVARVQGEDVGTYKIISGLYINENYSINIQNNAYLTISKYSINVEGNDMSKIYGEQDPEYEIVVTSSVPNGINVLDLIERESGEDVGRYLIKNKENSNYDVIFAQDCYLEILPKDVFLTAEIQNKFYDGTTTAFMQTPIITGLIDNEIILNYDLLNHADFVSAEVGENIAVTLHDITLSGENAQNYNLILPTLYANIRHLGLQSENNQVSISSTRTPLFTQDTNFVCEKINEKSLPLSSNELAVAAYDMTLIDSNGPVDLNSDTLKVKINLDGKSYNNLSAYLILEDGTLEKLKTQQLDDGLEVTTHVLGRIIITCQDETWIDIACYICASVMTLILIVYAVVLINKKKNKGK